MPTHPSHAAGNPFSPFHAQQKRRVRIPTLLLFTGLEMESDGTI